MAVLAGAAAFGVVGSGAVGAGAAGAQLRGGSHSGPARGVRRPVPAVRPTPSPARLLAGVGPLPAGWVAADHTMVVDGVDRTYLTVQPLPIDGPLPLVVLMSGRGMTPDGILHISGLAAQIGPAVLVVPAGWEEFWNAGDCCGAAYLHRINDVAFIRDAVKAVTSATPQVSATQVYAVGFSNGGRLAYHLACDLPGVFSGMMAVEAVPVQACPSMRPVDVTVVAQQTDPLLTVVAGGRPKYVGGFAEPTVAATVADLATLDGCRSRSAQMSMGHAVERTWSCAGGTRLRYVWYPGGSHSWRPAVGSTPGATDFVRQLMDRPMVGGAVAQLTGAVPGPTAPRGRN